VSTGREILREEITAPRELTRAVMRSLTITLLILLARGTAAGECVRLQGDAAGIGELLTERGIRSSDTCALAVTIERLDEHLVLHIARDGSLVDRMAADARTAATIIESFVREDIGDALLAARAAPPPPPPPPAPAVHDDRVVAISSPPSSRRGVQLFGELESSYGNDGTGWVGAHVGACIMLGPVCAAARIRHAEVVGGPEVWDQTSRRSAEVLLGIDVPFALGRMLLSPGFAAGMGVMHTRGETHDMRVETGGLRADVHATLSVPLWRKLALDVFGAADLTQEAHVEWGPEMVPLPPEPRLLLRVGVGLRYEGL
jgi:hypothetical protein